LGVIETFRQARKQVDCTLVLVGNNATDDPESEVILETIRSSVDESMREKFLMSRLLEDWLDLLAEYERPVRQ
jgi:hypothetical protein